jgi:nucleoside-triphosphatase THEP1
MKRIKKRMNQLNNMQISKITELLNELKEKRKRLDNIIEHVLENYDVPVSVDYEYGQLNFKCNNIIDKLTEIFENNNHIYSTSDIYAMHQGGVKFNKDLNLICI